MNNQKWNIDQTHSSIEFKIKHMMITNIKGNFTDYQGEMTMNEGDFESAALSFTAAVASINTKNADRDKHLLSADFFDAEQYPTIAFSSTKVTKKSGNDYTITGELTMHGATKTVNLDTEFGGAMKDPWGNTKLALNVIGKINRKDWNLNWNSALETGGVLVSEEVKLEADLQFILA
ncbi:YceI family protein [Flavobacterium sp. JP2137]|uniref:YceI family protein n=1 Tax=Flavobacterium sp. JP2137 TaxID=3414510 RepID=UPI003D2FADFB